MLFNIFIIYFRKLRDVCDFGDGPLNILSGIQLLDVDIDTDNSAIKLGAFFQFFWNDCRIKIQNASVSEIVNVDPSLIEKIWLPDVYFYDLRSFTKHELFRDVQGGIRLNRTKTNVSG